jgi:2-iminobutanoate/2-iminopropanoate deaminase
MAQAIEANGFIFTVTVPRHPQTLEIPPSFVGQARQAFADLQAVLVAAGSSLPTDLVKLNVYLSDMGNWEEMNSVYMDFIDPDRPPCRCTVQVARMNNDYMIELDAVALAAGR